MLTAQLALQTIATLQPILDRLPGDVWALPQKETDDVIACAVRLRETLSENQSARHVFKRYGLRVPDVSHGGGLMHWLEDNIEDPRRAFDVAENLVAVARFVLQGDGQ
jgi:hypothetical protein